MDVYADVEHKKAPYSVRIVKFGCDDCGRRWQSANGSLKDYQKCKRCYKKCYPSSYKIQAPNKRGNENRGTFKAHNTKLCGRCDRLGYSCMELGNDLDRDRVLVSGADTDEVVLTKSDDLSSFMVTKKKNKGNKYMEASNRITESSSTSGQVNKGAQRSVVTAMIFNEKRPNEEECNTSNKNNDVVNTQDRILTLNINEKIHHDKYDNALNMDDYHYDEDEQNMFSKNFIDLILYDDE